MFENGCSLVITALSITMSLNSFMTVLVDSWSQFPLFAYLWLESHCSLIFSCYCSIVAVIILHLSSQGMTAIVIVLTCLTYSLPLHLSYLHLWSSTNSVLHNITHSFISHNLDVLVICCIDFAKLLLL